MAEIKLKSKKNIGAGNFEYVYQCFCDPRPLKDITVTSGNDNEAQQLAQQECDEYCASKNEGRMPGSAKIMLLLLAMGLCRCIAINPVIRETAAGNAITKQKVAEQKFTDSLAEAKTQMRGKTSAPLLNRSQVQTVRYDASSRQLLNLASGPVTGIYKNFSVVRGQKSVSDSSKNIHRTYFNGNGKVKLPFSCSYTKDEAKKNAPPQQGGCLTEEYSFTSASSTFMNADYESQGQYIFPSAIYRMSDFENGRFNEVSAGRNEVIISTDNPNMTNRSSIVVKSPNIINVREAVRTLYENFDEKRAGNMDFRYRIYESDNTIETQLKISAGGGISFAGFGAKTENTFENSEKSQRHYITVDIVKDLFAINSFPIGNYFSSTSSDTLLVVNSVTYGVRVLANIDITGHEEQFKFSSSTSASFAAFNGHINLNSANTEINKEITVNCYIVGGTIQSTCSFTLDEFLKEIPTIVKNTTYNSARPIEYSLSDLEGNIFSIQSAVSNIRKQVCPGSAVEYAYLDVLTGKDDKDPGLGVTFALYQGEVEKNKIAQAICFENVGFSDYNATVDAARNSGFSSAGNLVGVASACNETYFKENTHSIHVFRLMPAQNGFGQLAKTGGVVVIRHDNGNDEKWDIQSVVLFVKIKGENTVRKVTMNLGGYTLKQRQSVVLRFDEQFSFGGIH